MKNQTNMVTQTRLVAYCSKLIDLIDEQVDEFIASIDLRYPAGWRWVHRQYHDLLDKEIQEVLEDYDKENR